MNARLKRLESTMQENAGELTPRIFLQSDDDDLFYEGGAGDGLTLAQMEALPGHRIIIEYSDNTTLEGMI
jgi:hypothetical protein